MNPMTESAQFTDLESEDIVSYRPVNRWAILAVVLGLFSPAALLHPFLLVLAAGGIIASLLAARQLARQDIAQTGQTALRWGLGLSILFGSCVGTSVLYRQYRLTSQARVNSEYWLELMREGKVREAHQLMLNDDHRAAPGQSLDDYYAPPSETTAADGHDHSHPDAPQSIRETLRPMELPHHEQLSDFLATPVVVRMNKLGGRARYEYLSTVRTHPASGGGLYIEQLYRVTSADGRASDRFTVKVVLERSVVNRVATWKVSSVEEDTSI